MRYLWDYGGTARDLIRAMKYHPSIYLTRYSGALVAQALPTLFPDRSWDRIVPIPSSPETLKKRHFHPCHEMAHIVKKALPNTKVSYPNAGVDYDVDLILATEPNLGDTYAAVTSRSYHTSGVNSLLMDGSVRFISNSIKLETWRALGTRSGGEVVGEY